MKIPEIPIPYIIFGGLLMLILLIPHVILRDAHKEPKHDLVQQKLVEKATEEYKVLRYKHISIVDIDGHSYILIKNGVGGHGILHNENCWCKRLQLGVTPPEKKPNTQIVP